MGTGFSQSKNNDRNIHLFVRESPSQESSLALLIGLKLAADIAAQRRMVIIDQDGSGPGRNQSNADGPGSGVPWVRTEAKPAARCEVHRKILPPSVITSGMRSQHAHGWNHRSSLDTASSIWMSTSAGVRATGPHWLGWRRFGHGQESGSSQRKSISTCRSSPAHRPECWSVAQFGKTTLIGYHD